MNGMSWRFELEFTSPVLGKLGEVGSKVEMRCTGK